MKALYKGDPWPHADAVIAVENGRRLRSLMCGGVLTADQHRAIWINVHRLKAPHS